MPPSRPIIAADPGAKGGIVYGTDDFPTALPMPADLDEESGMFALFQIVRDIKGLHPDIRGVVEQVGGYVGEAQPASSAFKFGGADTAIRMALAGNGILGVTRVAPVSWQKHFELPRRLRTSSGKAQHKRDLKDKAIELFPNNKVTLATADAFLLYHLARKGVI